MTHSLADVPEVAQRVADLLDSALHAAVEVVDRELLLVAGTGPTQEHLGVRLHAELYIRCLRTGLPAWAEAAVPEPPGPLVACPVMVAGDAVGAMGLVPIMAGQGASLRAHAQQVTDLLLTVADLLGSAAGRQAAAPATLAPAAPAEAVLDSLPNGVLGVDRGGVVLYCNRAALEMLRADMDLTGQLLAHWYPPGAQLGEPEDAEHAREVVFQRNGHRFRFFQTVRPLRRGAHTIGTLIVLREPAAPRSPIRREMPTLADADGQLIREALARYGTSGEGKRRAARALGISLATLYRKLRHLAR
ncbi:MAG TPA: PAS domain-containing protein [bacterium]|nr:PAS domain-containing protein [bacterium]